MLATSRSVETLFAEFCDLDRIHRAATEGQLEGILLEFKEAQLDKGRLSPETKATARRAIGALANTVGGVIVWGIEAKNLTGREDEPKEAVELKPISQVRTFCQCLSDFEAVERGLQGLQHEIVLETEDAGYVITYVPEALRKPVQSTDNKFYERSSSNSRAMTGESVRAWVLAREKPELRLSLGDADLLDVFQESKLLRRQLEFPLFVTNVGSVMASGIGLVAWEQIPVSQDSRPRIKAPFSSQPVSIDGVDGDLDFIYFPDFRMFPGVTAELCQIRWSKYKHHLDIAQINIRAYLEGYSETFFLASDISRLTPRRRQMLPR